MAYQYRGTQPLKAPTHARGTFDPNKCGTYAGYKQHQNHSVTPCTPCKKANSENVLAWRKRKAMAA